MPEPPRIDCGDLRDKVAAPDPAKAPLDTDSEAAGFYCLPERLAADAEQARKAQQEVPYLDPDRAVSPALSADLVPRRRAQIRAMWIWTMAILAVIIAAFLANLVYRGGG